MQEIANAAYLQGFPFSCLLRVAPYCVPGGIRVVSKDRGSASLLPACSAGSVNKWSLSTPSYTSYPKTASSCLNCAFGGSPLSSDRTASTVRGSLPGPGCRARLGADARHDPGCLVARCHHRYVEELTPLRSAQRVGPDPDQHHPSAGTGTACREKAIRPKPRKARNHHLLGYGV